jgi:hypothetical protein
MPKKYLEIEEGVIDVDVWKKNAEGHWDKELYLSRLD